jgi:hypothetical protein
MIVTKPHFSYKYQSTVEKKGGENFGGRVEKILGGKRTQKNLKRLKLSSLSNQAAAHSPLLLPDCNSLSQPPHLSPHLLLLFQPINTYTRALYTSRNSKSESSTNSQTYCTKNNWSNFDNMIAIDDAEWEDEDLKEFTMFVENFEKS